jgi:thiazole synthase
MDDKLRIAGREFSSRLLLGTGKFPSSIRMRDALEASGTEIVTVTLRRVDLTSKDPNLLEFIDRDRYQLLPNTSGAETAEDAIRLARLSRAAGLSDWIKLEVTPDPRYLLPDPVLAKRLQEAGAVTVMPLGSPIGSNRGLRTRDSIAIIIEQAEVPVVVDAGIGAPSHASEAMEMGADCVLVNTAIAIAEDPAGMARAFRLGVEAGRLAYLSGRAPERVDAEASSPLTGFLGGPA